jgi:hypothetical protein
MADDCSKLLPSSRAVFFSLNDFFRINWTFNRRETLLKDIAELKATCLAIYYCFRDWQNPTSTLDLKLRKEMWRMLVNIGRFMMHKGTTIHEIYSSFDEIAHVCCLFSVD